MGKAGPQKQGRLNLSLVLVYPAKSEGTTLSIRSDSLGPFEPKTVLCFRNLFNPRQIPGTEKCRELGVALGGEKLVIETTGDAHCVVVRVGSLLYKGEPATVHIR